VRKLRLDGDNGPLSDTTAPHLDLSPDSPRRRRVRNHVWPSAIEAHGSAAIHALRSVTANPALYVHGHADESASRWAGRGIRLDAADITAGYVRGSFSVSAMVFGRCVVNVVFLAAGVHS
jgi:hypothetical protein